MKPPSIVMRISFSLALISASLVLLAHTFGLLPDAEKIELESRSKISEALAVQLISAASKNQIELIQETIGSVVARNPSIVSVALKKSNGENVAIAGDHKANWVDNDNKVSTPTHIQVPILNGQNKWGVIEIVFVPLPTGVRILGVPSVILILIGFLGIIGLAGNYLVLGRSLKVLDPSGVVPERVQKAFDTLAEGVLIVDEHEQILLTNVSFASEINSTVADLLGKPAASLPWVFPKNGNEEFPWSRTIQKGEPIVGATMELKVDSGEVLKFTVNATPVSDAQGTTTGAIITFDDVTALEFKNTELNQMIYQLKETEVIINRKNTELHQLATRDPLTDCLNRRAFFEALDNGIDTAREAGETVFCMMMDLDHFKNVNDTYGHAVGDEVIIMLGDILNATCTGNDIAGRYGGEEFCVALFGTDEQECYKTAEKIRQSVIDNSRRISALDQPVTTSIGISRVTEALTESNELIDEADKALYAAKSSGRNRVCDSKDITIAETDREHLNKTNSISVSTSHSVVDVDELSTEEKIRNAIKLNDFCLHYQPIIDLRTGHVNSVEVLLRCNNEALLDLSIQSLVNVAEQSGLIIEIGEWVLLNALKQYRQWLDDDIELPKISVNISPVQLSDPVASVRVRKIIRQMDIEPHRLQLEITESAMIEDINLARKTLKNFQKLGVSVAIDDFGTGYSSISYLQHFKPDTVKIDRSYVSEIVDESSDISLVSSMISMSQKQGSHVVAEGVETSYQLDQLIALGCEYVQGYLISKPMTADNMRCWLQLFARRKSEIDQASVQKKKAGKKR